MSRACRSLISRILVSQRTRIHVDNIRNDSWLAASLVTAQTSTSDTLMDVASTLSKVNDNELTEKSEEMDKPPAQMIEARLSHININDPNNNCI